MTDAQPGVSPGAAAAAEIAAGAATLVEAPQQETVQVDQNGRPVVPGFTADPVMPEPFLPGEQPQAVQETATEESSLPSFEADTKGIEDLLVEEETEDVDEDVQPPEPADEAEDDYEADPEIAKLKKQLAAKDKRLEWSEGQRIKASAKGWREEAKRRFPLAPVDEIEATSRRALLKAANKQHDSVYRALEPYLGALRTAQEAVATETRVEARAEAERAWGRPSDGVKQPMIEVGQRQAEEQALDRGNFRNLGDRVSALMKAGKLNI